MIPLKASLGWNEAKRGARLSFSYLFSAVRSTRSMHSMEPYGNALFDVVRFRLDLDTSRFAHLRQNDPFHVSEILLQYV